MATWCINSENRLIKMIFLYHFKKIVVRCGRICCSMGVLRRTACLVVGPVGACGFAYVFNCTTVGRASD